MKNNIKFSLILSLYDKIKLHEIKRSLKSIYNQRLKPNEIIFIFDGPCSQIIKDYVLNFLLIHFSGQYTILYNRVNRGIAYSYNRAIKKTLFDIVAIQDSDDTSVKQRFYLQINEFKKNTDLTVLAGSVLEFRQNTKYLKKNPTTNNSIKRHLFIKNPINHPTVMINKKNLKKNLLYKECKRMEDYYLWINLISKKFIFKNLPNILVKTYIDQGFLNRRTSFLIIFSEIKIQLLLIKKFKIYLLMFWFIFPLKVFYHLTPNGIKYYLRNLINYIFINKLF
jgi:glycosyltransferase involved in cell wall biosynthesis